jgi:imidazolonepropionase-like amidohydrolase
MNKETTYCIKGANIFQADAKNYWITSDLAWRGNKFVESCQPPTVIINGENTWITPGLIDCHVHVCGESVTEKAKKFHFDEPEELAMDRGTFNTEMCLRYGVTTVRDMGNYDRRGLLLRDRLRRHSDRSTRVFSCGHLITGIEGHGKELGIQASDRDLQYAISCELEADADHIKIINDPIYFSEAILRQAVELCNNSGKPLACHAYTKDSATLAMKAGVNSIEHAAGWKGLDSFNAHITRGFLVPTSVSAHDVSTNPVNALIGLDDASLDVFKSWWNDLLVNLPNSIHDNFQIGVGTDSGFPPTEFGISVWREMALLNKFGMTWGDCFAAATKTNSKILQQPLLGNLSTGSFADFIVFLTDPLQEGIESKNEILKVYIDGKCAYGKEKDFPYI